MIKKDLKIGFFILTILIQSCNNSNNKNSQPARSAGDISVNTLGTVNFNMVYVPGGITTFTGMFDSGTTTIANAYEIASTEVTYELWSVVYNWAISNGYSFNNPGRMGSTGTAPQTNQHPVTVIDWRDAMVWCNALTEYYNAQNGTSYAVVYNSDSSYSIPIRSSVDAFLSINTTPGAFDNPYVNLNANGFRLPTSDESELAGRYINDANGDGDIMDPGEYYPGNYASGSTAPYTDSVATDLVSWYTANSGGVTHPVATKNPNALGLYDMSGNVNEWNFDWWTAGSTRYHLGGDWIGTAMQTQIGTRSASSPFSVTSTGGLRVARNP